MSKIQKQQELFIENKISELKTMMKDEKDGGHNLTINGLYDMYYECKLQIKNKKNPATKKFELMMIAIKRLIDLQQIDSSDLSYPDYNESDFLFNISKKVEFNYYQNIFNPVELKNKCKNKAFELGNHQIFLRNFINPSSPYNGLLIFHGVGVGKTCSGVTISNQFRDIYMKDKKKKIIILVPKSIKPGWENTIYNPSFGEKQCTGDTFNYIIRNKTGFNKEKSIQRKKKKVIKEFYEIYGYAQFSNKIKKLIEIKSRNNPSNPKILEMEAIKEFFSNRLLIIDEVHNIRSEKEDKEKISRDTIKNIDKVIEYSENLKLILLSATPMFNQPNEIIWLLNMLLKNDKRPILKESDIFNNSMITEKGKKILAQKSRGYVSYLRGENPITFPIRLYPEDKFYDYPVMDFQGIKRLQGYNLNFVHLYTNIFEGTQKKVYDDFIKTIKTDKLTLGLNDIGKQISNIVYPGNYYGERGFLKTMNYGKKISYIDSDPKKRFFDEDKLKNFSIKMSDIIQKVKNSEGIIFIYSQYIYSGLLPMALALEHCGYKKLSGNLMNEKDLKNKKNLGNYIILSGDKKLSPNNEKEIKILTSKSNKEGNKVKIVLGNVVASEGLDLKNIREIHILDPWFHLNKIEQIIGRGIRFCSHINLDDEKKRNVTVYLHCGMSDTKNESVDSYIYREAESKAYGIGQVEMVLKENSIDCYLNKSANYIDENSVFNSTQIDSQKKERKDVKIYDQPSSKICSWSENCDFRINLDNQDEINNKKIEILDNLNEPLIYKDLLTLNEKSLKEYALKLKLVNKEINELNKQDLIEKIVVQQQNISLDYSTFNINYSKEILKKINNLIQQLFSIKDCYDINEMIELITDEINVNTTSIYYELSNIIKNKQKILNKNNINGKIINKDSFYIFYPYHYNENIISNFYRNNYIDEKEEYIVINKMINIKEDYEKLLKIEDISDFIEKIKKYKFLENLNLVDENIFIDLGIDHLFYDEKKILIERIIETNDTDSIFYNSIKQNLIRDNFKLFENEGTIIGYFLTNYKVNSLEFYIYEQNAFRLLKPTEIRKIKQNNSFDFNQHSIWGYSQRNDIGQYIFKLVDEKKNKKGFVLGADQNKRENIIELFRKLKYYDDILEEKKPTKKGKKISEDRYLYNRYDLSLMMDIIFRTMNKKKKYKFINYDLVKFKFNEKFE